MKNLLKLLSSLALMLCFGQLTAQESTYVRSPGYWTLGLNGGLAYQSSDLRPTLEGWGVGATLAKNLYYRPGAPLIFDLRGRLLYDQSYGLDHKPSFGIQNNSALQDYRIENGGPGYAFINSKTHHGELGLEGVLSFNRLREKTNVNLSLFGGIGLDYYATYTDQKSNGQIYDYTQINPDGRRGSNKTELERLRDGTYETKADGFGDNGKLAFMPAVGVELGYQFTPRFSIGLGHKLTFTKTDLFDGNQWDENNFATANNDWHHYTNLHFRWILDKKERALQPPEIELMIPFANPHKTNDPLAIIKAKIKHINSAMDVDYEVNGRRADFDFRSEILNDNFNLRPGRNVVNITATNNAGSDNERLVIFYEEGGTIITTPTTPTNPSNPTTPTDSDVRRPRVNFTNPSRATEYVQTPNYTVTATVLNVDRKRDIEFKLNGRKVSNFDFDSRNDRFTSSIQLNEGQNNLSISVCNASTMTDSDEARIVLEKKTTTPPPPTTNSGNPPVVKITRPSNDPHRVEDNTYRIEADVLNVRDKIDVSVRVNGKRIRTFTFSNNKTTATVTLKEGNNTIKVTGKNRRGEDSDQTVIIYKKEEVVTTNPPTVKITSVSQPTVDPFNPNQCKVSVTATVKNVDSKNEVKVYLDGNNYSDFTYTASRDEVRVVFTLTGTSNHTVRIRASNSAGSDEDSEGISSCSSTPTGEAPDVDITAPTKTTTDKASTTVRANVERVTRKNDVSLLVNGKNTNFSYDSKRKTISANITLNEGSNSIKVTGTNAYGSDSDNMSIRYNKVVAPPTPKKPPVVNISSPKNNKTIEKNSASLTATVKNVLEKKDISVLLNGRKVGSFSFSTRGGRVTATVKGLKEGTNKITVKATNKDGRDEATVNVIYKPKVVVVAPKVKITSPKNGTSTEKTSATLKASVTNVTSKKDITVKVNGKGITNFSFSRGAVSATVSLKDGKNTIFVEGRNSGGKDSDQVQVTYKKKVAPPTVKITSPRNGLTSAKNSVLLKATLTNVASKSDIVLKVNGRAVSKFTYGRGKLTATVTLKAGRNSISVEGSNAAGKDTDKINVSYTKPSNPPQISGFALSQPTVDPFNPTSGKSTVTANLINITSSSQIKLFINGKQVRDFEFSSKNNRLRKVFDLKKGTNTVKISLDNGDGRKEETKTINF